ncbi:NUDIX hydrolase [bacterium]|nr:MAG: NUDIX hydrolase [bacterium]
MGNKIQPDYILHGPRVVCSAFIEKDGKCLLFLCPGFKVWRVPGGRVEFNETLEQTMIREMKEEIGLDVENPKFLGWGQDHQYHFAEQRETSRLLIFFHVKIEQDPKVDPGEAEEFKWVTLDEIKQEKNKEGALTDFFIRHPGFKL